MKLRLARKILKRVNGIGYGPKAPGYRFSTACHALHVAARHRGRFREGLKAARRVW